MDGSLWFISQLDQRVFTPLCGFFLVFCGVEVFSVLELGMAYRGFVLLGRFVLVVLVGFFPSHYSRSLNVGKIIIRGRKLNFC